MEQTVPMGPVVGEPQEAPIDGRVHRWRGEAELRLRERRQTRHISSLLVVALSVVMFSVLRRALNLAFSVPSHMSMSSGSEDEADSQSLVDEGEAFDSFKTLYSFPKIHNPAMREMLQEVLHFVGNYRRNWRGYRAHTFVSEYQGLRLHVQVRLKEEGEKWPDMDTAELAAIYLEAAINGSVNDAQDSAGDTVERGFSLFSFTGKGRMDVVVRAELRHTLV
ncbi:hypothetical protein, conserved [Eimeria necatrix]|uniref:Uncharacterized protein n=1 Tax=Eimeria necatrix TaxID=51315 RepID=U6MKV2_9EIME|nr:hypothetical protein, conserved [Eimeria necatrix]CDJ64631.1 hypothetical protein, conserved [Eimeria necatrix]